MESVEANAVVMSASSDIGSALCERWVRRGWKVFGTYRTNSASIEKLRSMGLGLLSCDLSEPESVRRACTELRGLCPNWRALVICPGSTEPVGPFLDCNFQDWADSIRVNFTAQMQLVHELLNTREVSAPRGPSVIFFAGGGTNDAPRNYSAYIISKIALIKMCELLDAEVADTKFSIIGPGWVKTKIHSATLRAGRRAGSNYQKVVDRLKNGEGWTPMDAVLDCCDWIVNQPRQTVSGRNFSVVYDAWKTAELESALAEDPNLYKLRRHGNDRLVRSLFTRG